MRFVLGLPTDDVTRQAEFGTAPAVSEMARAAEDFGFDGVYVTDHPIPPDRFLETGGHHTLDPTTVLGVAAAATTRLRLMTNLYIIAYRNPFLAAKAIATLDSLSEGRVILGTGAGYLEPEFRALGVDFERRNEILDASLELMKRVWSGESVTAGSVDAESAAVFHTALPRPAARPHPPIWIGGNSQRAIRRALELADGWIPMPAPPRFARFTRTGVLESLDDLRTRIEYARSHARRIGRTQPLAVAFAPLGQPAFGTPEFSATAYVDAVRELAALGVGAMPVGVAPIGRGALATRKQFLELAETFGRTVIGPCADIEAAGVHFDR